MPNNEDIRRFYPPANPTPAPVPPEQDNDAEDAEEVEEVEEVEEQPDRDKKSVWIGSDAAGGKAKDGISDLFTYDSDAESADVDDLVEVDFDKDILDAGPDGTIEDLVRVDQSDIMGGPRRKKKVVRRIIRRRQPPTSPIMGGYNA